MNPPSLCITAGDHAKLSLLLRAAPDPAHSTSPHQLQLELDRAVIVDPKAIPPTIVTMGSRVEIEDLTTGEVEEYTLAFPEHANVDTGMLSVLAPIGTAIIGCTQGDEVSWTTPGGTRRIKLRRVVQPADTPTPIGSTLPAVLPRPP
ncbi:MAG: nucleoside diphosphate kinase regulator [Opitutaceae bacterium]|nr:nucleoside diphosphate kinase regulator [Opitutaceae bacterium]